MTGRDNWVRLVSTPGQADEVDSPDSRPLVLCKRWRLRPGADPDEVATFVRERVVPAYRRLSDEVTLGLQVATDGGSVVAVQRWSSGAAHAAVVSSGTYQGWWAGYEPCLVDWDAMVDLEDEWSSTEIDLGAPPGPP